MRDSDDPPKAAQLAAILLGNASTGSRTATVQRSHRFPLHHFTQIENMAKMANCSVAAMINQVIEVGIDSLYEYIPPEMATKLSIVTQEQSNKANSFISQTVGKHKADK